MKIKDIMQKKVICLQSSDTIYKAASMMKFYNIGFLPVEFDHKIVGVITDRDLTIKFLANQDSKEKQISNYMNTCLITVSENDDIKVALKIMGKEKIKRILVTNGKKIVGLLSFSDILHHYEKEGVLESLQNIFSYQPMQGTKEAEIDEFYL